MGLLGSGKNIGRSRDVREHEGLLVDAGKMWEMS